EATIEGLDEGIVRRLSWSGEVEHNAAHRSRSRQTNSVPWSTLMAAGSPTSRPTLSNISTTSAPRKVRRGSKARENRENALRLHAATLGAARPCSPVPQPSRGPRSLLALPWL